MASGSDSKDVAQVAANGLLDRRALLRGVAVAGAAATGIASTASAAEPLKVDPWTMTPGIPFKPYGAPSNWEKPVVRTMSNTTALGSNNLRTPHQSLEGIITPNPLHFVIARSGAPDIDPAQHRLVIHGKVKRPLVFTLEDLLRYPMESRVTFLECGGNSGSLWSKEPIQADVQGIHGWLSCAEWTGVRLSTLLDEAGVDPKSEWLVAEGADAATMVRSIPMRKAMDDAMIALYQNGERLHPDVGYPMRLLLPGYEGNMNVKWLRRLKVVDAPVMALNETRSYTILLDDGKAWRFHYPQEVKSFIVKPSYGMSMKGPGFYEISGLAWSGQGKISKVEVSADGGKSWAEAVLQEPVHSKALTRFRMAWRWDGQPVVMQSRAVDEKGNVQPTREAMIAERGAPRNTVTSVNAGPMPHVNAIMSWGIDAAGAVKHVYA